MLIETLDIRKTYPSPGGFLPFGRRPRPPALSGITLKLSSGCVTGLAGPNGAGKSTLLRILAGGLIPDAGLVRINGRAVRDAELRASAALVGAGPRSFYPRLTALENLYFFGSLYGLSRSEVRKRAEPLARLLSIGDGDLSPRFDALSEGAAQKFSLLRALMLRLPLLLLDEPARNLDTRSAAALSGVLKGLADEGRTAVVYASHNPAELAGVCGRLLALKNGLLVGEDSANEKSAAKACEGDL